MLERLASTGSGFPTVYVGDLTLHSRYNPRDEADRYINSLNFRDTVRFFIFMEPGLGYSIQALRKRFPGAYIIALHVSDFFTGDAVPRNTAAPGTSGEASLGADSVWSPGAELTLGQFLEKFIPDTEASSVAIVEWRPAQTAFGEAYLKVMAETVEYIKRSDANKRTTKNFGRRWFKNAFKNLRILYKAPFYPPSSRPVVITGAGPSLEEIIPLLQEQKKGVTPFILASSSSAPALLASALTPDLILAADGGNWALLHLYEALRGNSAGSLPTKVGAGDSAAGGPFFSANLTAALPSQLAHIPWLPISDGSLWQSLLLKTTGLPFVILPQRGTVTATAVDLALTLTQGPVYITGTDLTHRDIRTHVRPYSFERLFEEKSSRFKPLYSQAFVRAASIASSGSHGIYAQWFSRRMAAYPGRLFSVGNNSSAFDTRKVEKRSHEGFTAPGFPAPEGDGKIPAENTPVTIIRRKDRVGETISGALLRALDSAETQDTLAGELGPLLFPDDPQISPKAIREELRSAGMRYSGASHG
jgi:hypothetical protein